MIQVNNVSLKFGKRTLFEDVNLKFTNGNCYGLIGANGSGKSTFLKLLAGEIETTTGEITISKGERLSILRQDHYQYDDKKVLDVVIMGNSKLYEIIEEKNKLYQQSEFSDDDCMKIANLEAEFMELDGWNAESDAATLLNNLGIEEAHHQLLMGEIPVKERVKVLLAQALFGNPDVLLLDEPTNSLDLDAIRWLEEFLIDFENTVIIVSHDRHFLNKVCTHIADIDYGKIKLYVGNYDFWYESSELLQRQMRESNKKKEEKIKELQAFIARFSANASKSKQATSRKKMLEKIQLDEIIPSSRKYPYIDFKIEKPAGKEILKVENLTKIYGTGETKVKALDHVSFNVEKGEFIAITGASGSGKSTLLHLMGGVEKATEGRVLIGNTDILALNENEQAVFRRRHIGLIYQFYNLIPILTVEENILLPLLLDGKKINTKRLSGIVKMLGLEARREHLPSQLSGGQQQRVAIGRALITRPAIILADEPTGNLDQKNTLEIMHLFRILNQRLEQTILMITHDLDLAKQCDRIIRIEDGRV